MFKQVGDYELKTRIGRGNYADVYLGVHLKTKEQYAIKVISKEKFSHPKLIAGLESEVKIMKNFNHRNILLLKKYFSSANNFYLVLEYCAGGDLNKFIRKVGKLGEDHAFNFLSQIADGIAFLNEHGFLHRDLKTANVLLTEESVRATLKIADFGFARHLQGDTLAQTPCGTPLYMAPEVLSAGQYDAKADIWSIGCIFYEMLAGQPPFGGVNEADLLNNIRTRELRGPSDVSPASVSILKRLLEKNVSARASIQDLLQLCQHILRQSQSLASSSSQMKESALVNRTTASLADGTPLVVAADDALPSDQSGVDNDNVDVDDASAFPVLPLVSKHPTAAAVPATIIAAATGATAKVPSPEDQAVGSDKPSTGSSSEHPSVATATNNSHNMSGNSNEPTNATATRRDNHSHNSSSISSSSAPPGTKQSEVMQLPPTTPSTTQPLSFANASNNDRSDNNNNNIIINNNNNSDSNSNNYNNHTSNNLQDFSGNETDMYDDYELVNPQQQSHNNLPTLSNTPVHQNALNNPRKSQLSGALSPIPPTPSYIPMNHGQTPNATAPILPFSNIPTTISNTPPHQCNYINPLLSPSTGVVGTAAAGIPSRHLDTQQLGGNSPNPAAYPTSYLTTPHHANNNSTTNAIKTTTITTPSSSFMQYQDLYQKTIVQRWEVLGHIVLVATQVADHWLRQDMAASTHETNVHHPAAAAAASITNLPTNMLSSPPTSHPLLGGVGGVGGGSNPPLFSHAESTAEEDGEENEDDNDDDDEDGLGIPFAAPPSTNTYAKKTSAHAKGHSLPITTQPSKYVVESAEQVSTVLSALSLYLYAISLVKTFLTSVELPEDSNGTNVSNNGGNNHHFSSNTGSSNHDTDIGWLVLSRLRHEVLGIYLQLQARSEQCTMLLAQCVSPSPPSATAASSTTATTAWTVASQWRVSLPRAEALMLQEALRQEQTADLEEILGHVDRAQHLYEAARHLVVGVSLTFVEDIVDVRKQVASSLKAFVDQLENKILVCKQRATVVRGGFGLFSEGDTFNAASSSV